MTVAEHCRFLIERYGETPLFAVPGARPATATIREFYLPLLVDYTHEDAAAKGLRKFAGDQPQAPPVYFSALERACAEQHLLLLGERGSGKTSFALQLALNLAGEVVGSRDFNRERMRRRVPRNEHGAVLEERWTGEAPVPLYLPVAGPGALDDLIREFAPDLGALADGGRGFLAIIDGVERLGSSGAWYLAELVGMHPNMRILATGEPTVCRNWGVLSAFRSLRVLPLLRAQRSAYRQVLALRGIVVAAADNDATANPGLFALSLGLPPVPAAAHDIIDQYLAAADCDVDRVVVAGFTAFAGTQAPDPALSAPLRQEFAQAFLAARHLEGEPGWAAELFHGDPDRWTPVVQILAQRLAARGEGLDALARALASGAGDAGLTGAIVAAGMFEALPAHITAALLRIVEEGRLSTRLRAEAGRHLARRGDPRDLEALVEVTGGRFVMGSAGHPNSSPPHEVRVAAFRIGRYPVANRLYRRFVAATGRAWRSTDGQRAERSNAPAVDLTWRDARAFCAWLTGEWRAAGKIAPHEVVRLPTEPEWEYAARGAQPGGRGEPIYPWQGAWRPDHANSEEAGFNDTCAVGLFPKGRSAFGCEDMCGQLWEWCSTLWGADMATPSWKYPYGDDGREDADAPANIRRVLRGGCFSSGKEKACCTYRGSLEPDGFWRGNGFRVVVSATG
jgi:iron(II)-dependent oxidoreductase